MDTNIIRQILLEQGEEAKAIFKEKIIPREILPNITKAFRSNLIKVIIGVRRCGKSVLAHCLLKDKEYGYINFDDERLIGTKTQDLNVFLEVLQELKPSCRILLLDEIQNVDGWELFVNRLKRSGFNIVVTGSNSKLLSKELATHLTGRHFSIELYPFSFHEFACYKGFSFDKEDFNITQRRAKIKQLFTEYQQYGGLPEVLKLEVKTQYLRELYDRIITRDIILRYHIKYARDLKEVALYAISNFAARMTYHKIRRIFEMKSVHTVKNYVDFLQEAYLLFQVNAFSFKLKEQFKQPKKLYCVDPGIINAIVPKSGLDLGRLLENIVLIELKRQGNEVYFYSQPNYEVDFLVKGGMKISQLIQVCHSIEDENTRKRELKALIKASQALRCNELLIITSDTESEEKIGPKKIRLIPIWKWMLGK
jgi:predicted AAA+ superfamily ATPase